MITEDYCDFETAKLLKEKGFIGNGDIGCYCGFYEQNKEYPSQINLVYDDLNNSELECNECLRFTHQMAMKWLREMCKCYIHIVPFYPHGTYSEPPKWLVAIDANYVPYPTMKNNFETYEEAAEAAIKYSLENLI